MDAEIKAPGDVMKLFIHEQDLCLSGFSLLLLEINYPECRR